jgi:hypothetical protein
MATALIARSGEMTISASCRQSLGGAATRSGPGRRYDVGVQMDLDAIGFVLYFAAN